MLNSVSFNPMFSSDILPINRGSVTVDGKTYPVKRVPCNDPHKCTVTQEYQDVVFINGKAYPVKQVGDKITCDKTKKVVVIDGREYRVNNGLCGKI